MLVAAFGVEVGRPVQLGLDVEDGASANGVSVNGASSSGGSGGGSGKAVAAERAGAAVTRE